MGANIEAEEVAESYGILRECSVDYHSDRRGTKAAWDSINMAVDCCMELDETQCCEILSKSDWKQSIREDCEKRQHENYDLDNEDVA